MGKQSRRKKRPRPLEQSLSEDQLEVAAMAWAAIALAMAKNPDDERQIRRRLRLADLPAKDQLQVAMMAEGLAKLMKRSCFLCGGKTTKVGVWHPKGDLNTYLGAPSGKIRLFGYAVCDECSHDQKSMGERIEKLILNEHRGHLAARDAGLAVEDNIAFFENPGDVDRFASAWEKHSPPL